MELPFDHTCADEALDTLAPGVLETFAKAAKLYADTTGQRLVVTSARRTLRRTAELMAAFTPSQLEALYCRNGYPSYVRELIAARNAAGRPLTGEEAYAILSRRSEGYVSAHLYGAAIDVRSDALADKNALRTILERAGFRTLDETECGIPCIHATLRSIPVQIICQ
jgi:hypothetical protein